MTNIFIINGAQPFGHSGGRFNNTLTAAAVAYFESQPGFAVKVANTAHYVPEEEVAKYVWADIVIYNFPVWWFQVPHKLKQYIDEVFTAGHNQGIYHSDGRHRSNPAINYGTGGQLHGRKYMVNTTWNAPEEAFTLPGEFFGGTSVDKGVLFGFHRMNAFTGMQPLEGIHFHDVEKNAQVERDVARYLAHLQKVLLPQPVAQAS